MILPNVRASFGPEEVRWVLRLLSRGDEERRDRWERTLEEEGLDDLLDRDETLERLLDADRVEVLPLRLVLYVLIRHALVDSGIESRDIADYVTALVAEFGIGRRARRIAEHGDREYGYLVDILEDLHRADGREAFLLQAHLGNFALWLSGLFPDWIDARVRRKGAPGLDYYEEMGSTGYRLAADDRHAEQHSLADLYRDAADAFVPLRQTLNRVSDRVLFPRPRSPVERLLRQARDGLGDRDLPH